MIAACTSDHDVTAAYTLVAEWRSIAYVSFIATHGPTIYTTFMFIPMICMSLNWQSCHCQYYFTDDLFESEH